MSATGHFGFVKAVARTDVGRKRKNNEDAFGLFHENGVFCVADGMGGGDDGEIASAAVVKGLEDGLKNLPFAPDGAYAVADVANVVEKSLTKASAWIFNRTRVKRLSGCGSTFVGFVLDATDPGKALAIHAGDSRLYLLHGRSIKQITHDHSVAEMIGEKDESKVNPMFRSMVMNAIGIRAKADPERTPFKVAPGDRILVCSDGLSRMVPDKKMLAISRKNEDVGATADALIAAALEAGGIDNVTVVLVEVGALPKPLTALAAPPVECVDEDATDGGERDTGSTGSGASSDSSQTMSTIAPAISEEMLAPEEADEVHRSKGPIVAGGIVLLVLVGVIIAAFVLKKDDQMPATRGLELPVVTNVVEEVPAATTNVTVETPPAKAVVVEVPVATNAIEEAVVVVAADREVVREPQPHEDVVKACDGEMLAEFCQALRRMEGAENRELAAQMKRFEGSARLCARMRTCDTAERTVVDLKYCLAVAERTHKVLDESKKPIAGKLLVWWKAINELEPTDASAFQAAALFMTHLPEAGRR